MEVNEVRGAMEWNRMELNGKRGWLESKGKRENIQESTMGPQGAGPCARVSGISYRTFRPNKWTKPIGHGTLRVTCDPWCHAQWPLVSYTREITDRREERNRKKIVRANWRNRDITPSPTRVLPRTQASPSILSSNSVLPSSAAEGEGGVP